MTYIGIGATFCERVITVVVVVAEVEGSEKSLKFGDTGVPEFQTPPTATAGTLVNSLFTERPKPLWCNSISSL